MKARLSNLTALVLVLSGVPVGSAQNDMKDVKGLPGKIPAKFREYEVILEPDKNEAEWWAGAPSVVRDEDGTFWLAGGPHEDRRFTPRAAGL
jgi:hypothetical protein